MISFERLLSRLDRAVPRSSPFAVGARAEPVQWPADLPPLPDELHQLLSWGFPRGMVQLSTLSSDGWRACAERTRAQPAQFHLSPELRLDARGVFRGDVLVADSLAELVELEVLVFERLARSPVRELRVRGPLAPWQPCPPPSDAQLEQLPPGTALFSPRQDTHAVKLAPRLWIGASGRGEPDALAEQLDAARVAARFSVRPELDLQDPQLQRSALRVRAARPLGRGFASLVPDLPPPTRVSEAEIDAFEDALGLPLPPLLRFVWKELRVGTGCLAAHEMLRSPSGIPQGTVLIDRVRPGELLLLDVLGMRNRVVLRWRDGGGTMAYPSLEEWLESTGAHHPPLTSPLATAWRQLEAEHPALLHRAAAELVQFSWADRPHGPPTFAVLYDWLVEREVAAGRASLATLISRLTPLLEP